MNETHYPLVNVKIAIEMAIEIVDLPIKNGGSFHSYVTLPEGIRGKLSPIAMAQKKGAKCSIFLLQTVMMPKG